MLLHFYQNPEHAIVFLANSWRCYCTFIKSWGCYCIFFVSRNPEDALALLLKSWKCDCTFITILRMLLHCYRNPEDAIALSLSLSWLFLTLKFWEWSGGKRKLKWKFELEPDGNRFKLQAWIIFTTLRAYPFIHSYEFVPHSVILHYVTFLLFLVHRNSALRYILVIPDSRILHPLVFSYLSKL